MGLVFEEITGKRTQSDRRPVWIMRQAGRYLPEYRAVRSKFKDFMEFCFTPDAATEVTLQPIDRFGLDAAIIFSDILVIPYALGQRVWFVTGEGPKLGELPSLESMQQRLESGEFLDALAPVYQALRQTRSQLPTHTDLFGFAGAPWTLLTYMLEGGSSNDYAKALSFADEKPEEFQTLLSLVTRAICLHLDQQRQNGANLLQVFDSWAAGIPADKFASWSSQPLLDIRSHVGGDTPMVLFAKGCAKQLAHHYLAQGADDSLPTAIAVGQHEDVGQVFEGAPNWLAGQGNLDPQWMIGDFEALDQGVTALVQRLAPEARHVVNLGHGVTPQGNPDNVQRLVERVHQLGR